MSAALLKLRWEVKKLQLTFTAHAFWTLTANIHVYPCLDTLRLISLETISSVCSKVAAVSLPDGGDVLAFFVHRSWAKQI